MPVVQGPHYHATHAITIGTTIAFSPISSTFFAISHTSYASQTQATHSDQKPRSETHNPTYKPSSPSRPTELGRRRSDRGPSLWIVCGSLRNCRGYPIECRDEAFRGEL
jgi:hypothetical protein